MEEFDFYCLVPFYCRDIKTEALRLIESQIKDANIYLPSIYKLDEFKSNTPEGTRLGVKIRARKRNKDDDLREQIEFLIKRVE